MKVHLSPDLSLEMVLIPAGKFMMGSPASEKGRSDNETQHEVTLTQPYYMGKYAVTQDQWTAVMGNNPSDSKRAKFPVTNVSFEACQEFIKKLNARKKGGYRLPTEAEWEYACRAGTTTAYSFGDTLTKNDANCIWGWDIKTMTVGIYEPNAFGLYDMHGNVWEFCEDWYAAYPEKSVTDPKGPETGERRVLRGGSGFNAKSYARSSNRWDCFTLFWGWQHIGFRLVREWKGASSRSLETPSRGVTSAMQREAPKIPAISETQIETHSNLEIYEIKGEACSNPEIVITRLDMSESKLDVKLRPEDYFKRSGSLLEKLCKDVVKSGKVTKGLFLEAKKFCKSNDLTGIPGGILLAKKIDSIVKTGHLSKKTSQEVVLLAREILGLEIPEIADTGIVVPSRPEMARTRIERIVEEMPVAEETEEVSEEELPHEGQKEKKGNNSAVFVLAGVVTGVVGGIALLGIIAPNSMGTKFQSIFSSGATGISDKDKNEPQISLAAGIGSIEKEMILIPATTFMMGSPASEKGHHAGEYLHEVTITKPFYMGKFEVTQEQWKSVMGDNPSTEWLKKEYYRGWPEFWESAQGKNLLAGEPKNPVTHISWNDCKRFIKKLNANTKGGYRLPTEAEWEYACRAGDSLTMIDVSFNSVVKAVGSYNPNGFGLYDMHGNVAEWCEDWFGEQPMGAAIDPKGPRTGTERVVRGWPGFVPLNARSTRRVYSGPTSRNDNTGFRLARTK